MVTMKGKWGSVPNTMVTRHSGRDIPVSEELCNEVDKYKTYKGSMSKESLVDSRKGRKRSRSRKEQPRSSRKRSSSGKEQPRSSRKRSVSRKNQPRSYRKRTGSSRIRSGYSRKMSASSRKRSSSRRKQSSFSRQQPNSSRKRSSSSRKRSSSSRKQSSSSRKPPTSIRKGSSYVRKRSISRNKPYLNIARMPSRGSTGRRKSGISDDQEDWTLHDTYDYGSASSRILTRSQAAFVRIKNTDSDFQLFADPQKYKPTSGNLPHLMVTMKGKWGSVPNTMVTRHSGRDIPVSEELCNEVDKYKRGSKSKESLVDTRKGRKRSESRKKRSESRKKRSESRKKRSRSSRKRSASGRNR